MLRAQKAKTTPQITRRLTIGYLGVAALNLLAFAIAFGLYREASTLQNSFINEQAPIALALRNIASSSQILFLETEEIALQQTPAEIAALRERVLAQEAQLAQLANHQAGTPTDIRQSFASTAIAINAALDAQATALGQKQTLDQQIDSLLDVFDALDLQTTRATYSTGADRSAWERTRLIASPWRARILVLPELARSELIESSRSTTLLELRDAAISVNRLPENAESTAVAARLYEVLRRLQASDNIFDSSIALLAQFDATTKQLSHARDAAASFSRLVQGQQTTFAAETNKLLVVTAKASRRAETALIVLALIAALTSFLLIRWVVVRGVADPLKEIAQRTDRIAHGDYREAQSDASHDYEEFQLINSALQVFEANARKLVSTQEELREKNEVLVQTVADLERFSYAASHDLRSPLRGIQTLTRFALDDLGNSASPEVRKSLSQIGKRSSHLEKTLNDLLEYARADAMAAQNDEIDLAETTEQIVDLFSAPDVRILVELSVKQLSAPRAVIALVLRNLIDNAIKHHPARIHTALPVRDVEIKIRSQETRQHGNLWTQIDVSDNGSGIPVEYRDRVVELFETLRPKSETGSSGMGLSLVRKLLLRHGGELVLGESPAGGLNISILWPVATPIAEALSQSTAAT